MLIQQSAAQNKGFVVFILNNYYCLAIVDQMDINDFEPSLNATNVQITI